MNNKPENLKCPDCGGDMISRKNSKTDQRFWGCKMYPECKGTRDTDGLSKDDKYKHEDKDDEGDSFDHLNRWNKR